ncbi:hypothetical protein BH11ACT3_BH11ACT3_12160 [soil metagenome]
MTIDAPIWRIVTSGFSWMLLAFSFAAFIEGMFAVLGVGGTCAEGGPYVISVHCPENSNLFTNVGIYGGVLAVFLNVFLGRNFGVNIGLAWTILFGLLGLVFSFGGGPFIIGGVLFFVMAFAPLALAFRGSVQRIFLGAQNAGGQRFREEDWARPTIFFAGEVNGADAVTPTARDWALSLGLAVIPAAVGAFLALTWWNAVSPAIPQ